MTYIILAVALALGYQIYRIGRDIYKSYQCLEEHTLKNFMYGRIRRDSEQYRHVVSHLAQCEECQEKLREIQRGKRLEDHLVDDDVT